MASFPQIPLPAVLGLAAGADPSDPSLWNFSDITADLREADGAISIQAGRRDEGSRVDATGMGVTVDNSSGNYCRTNPLGSMYGLLDKGSPIQARVTRINDAFARTTSNGLGTEPDSGLTWAVTSASIWSTNGSAALAAFPAANAAALATLADAAGDDVDVTHVASLSAVATGAAWVDATVVRYTDSSNLYRLHLEFGLAGALGVKIAKAVDGVQTDLTSVVSTGLTYSAGTKVRVRVRAIGPTLQIKAWLDGGSEPTAWNAQVDDDDLTGQATGFFQWRVAGNTNVGTLTATLDDFRVDVIRATTPVPEWPVRWDQSGNLVRAPISGAGILRRLGTGQSALRSPMDLQISGLTTLRAYWRGEDGAGATAMSSATPGVAAARVSDVTFAAADGPGGSDRLLTFGSAGDITGLFPSGISTSGWQWQWACNLAGADATERECMAVFTSNGYWWVWLASLTTYRLTVRDVTGTTIYSSSVGNGGVAPGDNIVFRLKVSLSGGTWTVEPGWYEENSPVLVGFTDTFSGSAGRPVKWHAFANTVNSGGYLGHAFVTTGVTESLQSFDMLNAINGYPDETAGNRLIRLSAQEGVPLRVFGDPDATAAMGAQRPATYLDLVRECEDADQGTLIETGAGLGYQTRIFRYNQSAILALDFDQGHIAAPPEPTDDDQRLINRVALTRTGGGSATVEDTTSIAKSGVYSSESTVNLADDDQLLDQAGWRLHLGTLDDVRWPRIELQLHSNTSLIKDWCKVRVGSRITISNPPDQVGVEDLDLIVEGWTETLGTWTWNVELVCSPGKAWDVGVYDSSSNRYDSRSTTLEAGLNPSDLLAGFVTTDRGDFWSWTSCPYVVTIAGQQNRVLGMSQPDSVAVVDGTFETGNTGTWTVTGGTLAASTVQAHRGSYSALVTTTGSPSNTLIRNPSGTIASASGRSYTLKMWVYCSVSRNVLAVIDFYNGASYLTSGVNTVAVTANTWTEITVSATAPATTTRMEYGPTMNGSPANGTLLYVDDLDILRTDSQSGRQLATLSRGVDGITKSLAAASEVHIATPGRWAL